MLHITNGETAAVRIRGAALEGTVLAWQDVLHEGPVPGNLSLDELSDVRARFIAEQGWGRLEDVRAEFNRRDATLAGFRRHDEVVLWFEHDLYDQLQLLQVLDWLAGQPWGGTVVSLLCIGEHPDVEPFHGLGQLDSGQITALFPARERVTAELLALAGAAWAAFRAPDPSALEAVLERDDLTLLAYLSAALTRHLEQFPSIENGLSRTEAAILDAVGSQGARAVGDIFMGAQMSEESAFMGDATFWTYLDRIVSAPHPLLRAPAGEWRPPRPGLSQADFAAQYLALTETGERVLRGEADHVALNGIDRWLGGVHLQGQNPRWRWDRAARCLRDTTAQPCPPPRSGDDRTV
jgi:hypothetical protein